MVEVLVYLHVVDECGASVSPPQHHPQAHVPTHAAALTQPHALQQAEYVRLPSQAKHRVYIHSQGSAPLKRRKALLDFSNGQLLKE